MREFEVDGIIYCEVYCEVLFKVEYLLIEFGELLCLVILLMMEWVIYNMEKVLENRNMKNNN